jgi:hypothetical protein
VPPRKVEMVIVVELFSAEDGNVRGQQCMNGSGSGTRPAATICAEWAREARNSGTVGCSEAVGRALPNQNLFQGNDRRQCCF